MATQDDTSCRLARAEFFRFLSGGTFTPTSLCSSGGGTADEDGTAGAGDTSTETHSGAPEFTGDTFPHAAPRPA